MSKPTTKLIRRCAQSAATLSITDGLLAAIHNAEDAVGRSLTKREQALAIRTYAQRVCVLMSADAEEDPA